MSKTLNQPGSLALAVDLSPIIELTDERFYELCQANRDLRLERTAAGELVIMSPTGGQTSRRTAQIIYFLSDWANHARNGVVFDSSGGFKLPNGAVRSPNAAWISLARWTALADEQKEKFVPLCPDFIIELRSASDALPELSAKMQEYLDNGARLAWLIDPQEKRVYLYRPGAQPEILENPEKVAGDPALAGFILPLQGIWDEY